MNYIVYGKNRIESSVYQKAKQGFSKDDTIYIDSDNSLFEAIKVVRFKPFFNNKWFVVINLDKLNSENVIEAVRLLNNNKVKCYMTINFRKDIYSSLRKSKALNSLKNLTILNAKFPSEKYIAEVLLSKVKKYFTNAVIKYVANNVRFNIEKLDQVIDDMNDFELDEITLTDIKKILPASKTRDVKSLVYTLLLNNRADLKEHWKDRSMKVLVQNAGTKIKPYQIVDEIELKPKTLLDIILKIFKDMNKVKKLYMDGVITETSVFKDKDKLENKIPFLKSISIPSTIEYILVSREVTFYELNYCMNKFLTLKEKEEISIEDIYLIVYQLMNRHSE